MRADVCVSELILPLLWGCLSLPVCCRFIFLNLFCRLNLFTRTMINPLISVASCRIFVLLMPEYLFTGIKTCTKAGNYAGCMPDCVWH